MAEFQAQAYICPVCHDDHSGDKPHTFWPTELAAHDAEVAETVIKYVRQVLNDPKYGGNIAWVHANLHTDHLRSLVPTHPVTTAEQIVAMLSGPFDGTEGLDSFTLAWAIGRIEAS